MHETRPAYEYADASFCQSCLIFMLNWTIDHGTMSIKIRDGHTVVMSIFLGEAMELAGRRQVMKHVAECDRSLWLHDWQQEKQEAEAAVIADILAGNS